MGGWVYDPTYRNSSSVILEDDKLEKNFKNITNNRHKNNKIAIQFTEYNVGQFYGWHEDHDRIQSFTLLLNDDFEGGDLEFKNEGNINKQPFDLFPLINPLPSLSVIPNSKSPPS